MFTLTCRSSFALAVVLAASVHLLAAEKDIKPAKPTDAADANAVAAKLPADRKPRIGTDETKKPADQANEGKANESKANESKANESKANENKANEKTEPAAGHSMHGEAFDEGPRQAAYLMGGTGDVHFPVTTRVPEAQKFFDQGVGQLHGFWYFEAERSFRQVLLLDPNCAMAYWGMAMANTNNDKRAKELIKKAQEMKAIASPREIAWIDSLAASYEGEDTSERRQKYVRDLEALVQSDPNDVEAKALLALRIWQNGSWMTERKKQLPITSHQAVDSILDQVFAANPMHPAHHFRIHLWDREKAARRWWQPRVAGSRRRRSPTCGTCRGTSTRSCIAMPTAPGNRKPRPAWTTPT